MIRHFRSESAEELSWKIKRHNPALCVSGGVSPTGGQKHEPRCFRGFWEIRFRPAMSKTSLLVRGGAVAPAPLGDPGK